MLNIQELSGKLFLYVYEEVETWRNGIKGTFHEIRRNSQITDCRPKEGRDKKVSWDCFTRSFLAIKEFYWGCNESPRRMYKEVKHRNFKAKPLVAAQRGSSTVGKELKRWIFVVPCLTHNRLREYCSLDFLWEKKGIEAWEVSRLDQITEVSFQTMPLWLDSNRSLFSDYASHGVTATEVSFETMLTVLKYLFSKSVSILFLNLCQLYRPFFTEL
jgi:hypothetical protein